jgi:hypothetical protein
MRALGGGPDGIARRELLKVASWAPMAWTLKQNRPTGGTMRGLLESGKALMITKVLGSAGTLTVLVAVLAAGRKWN